ncbi:MAG: RcnB family protein [Alphaproteobacteria bacterium]|nr:RcnB family protein [Alphaproteobacteria bacterium]
MNKHIKTFALASLMAVGSLGVTSTASAQQYRDRDRNERHDNDRGRDDRGRDNNHRSDRWNQRQHNGYYSNGRFYYGQPSAAIQARRDYRPAWQQWRRGDRLPSYARTQYREVDWRREHYREPPRGYHYVRDDRGEVLLVAVATGVILSILLNN